MTDEQIRQKWEKVLSMSDEPIGEHWGIYVTTQFAQDTRDLINRKDAEIERLEGILNRRCDVCPAVITAVKEFAERLKSLQIGLEISGESLYYIPIDCIDNLVKEMTEPVKLEHDSLCETETFMGSDTYERTR